MAKTSSLDDKHIPVIIGNCAPFRLVFRPKDKWTPTLEEINNRKYDYVKLARLSCFIDIGIAPYSLAISFDGSLILPALEKFRTRESAVDKFNEMLGILLLGGVYSEAIHPTDISFGRLFFDGYLKFGGGGTGKESLFHQSIVTKHVGTIEVINLLEPRTITVAEIRAAYKRGTNYFSNLTTLSPSLLLNGVSGFVKHQWADSLIFLWTSIEQILNIVWTEKIIKAPKSDETIIEGRSTFLKDYRTWTTATKIELLYQKGFIPAAQYKLLNLARKSRNDFVHNGTPLKEANVRYALESLFHLISLVNSDYKDAHLLDDTINVINKNQRGDLIPRESRIPKDNVTHWLEMPPLPGDPTWGKKKYEKIENLRLKPMPHHLQAKGDQENP